jgi:hypothetical protein
VSHHKAHFLRCCRYVLFEGVVARRHLYHHLGHSERGNGGPSDEALQAGPARKRWRLVNVNGGG